MRPKLQGFATHYLRTPDLVHKFYELACSIAEFSHLRNAENRKVSSIQALAWLNAIVEDDLGDEIEGENVVQKKTGDAISRRNFMFQFATELKEAYVQEKTAELAKVLLPLFNNSYQNSIVNGSRKRKQSQVNINYE